MRPLIRALAVIALALSPVWGFQSVHAASSSAPLRYPVWPSFLSTGCTALQGPGGSTTVSCGGGAFLLSQVNSGYECTSVDISVSSYQQGSFLAVGTVDSGSVSNAVQIDGTGNYFMQFPGFLTNNTVTVQLTAGSDGTSMTFAGITTSPCPVPSATATTNPSSTATNTAVPVTGTPTPIATNTPLPSGHSSFTPTISPTGTVIPFTATPSVTSTPVPFEVDCGSVSFPILNCTFLPLLEDASTEPYHWVSTSGGGTFLWYCSNYMGKGFMFNNVNGENKYCSQSVKAGATGELFIQYQADVAERGGSFFWATEGLPDYSLDVSSCSVGGGTFCIADIGNVVNGDTYAVGPAGLYGSSQEREFHFELDNAYVVPSGGTPGTPTITATPLPSSTPTPAPGTATQTGTVTETPAPIPGAMSTAIATATECPGGCAVAKLTSIPGMATRVTVDTSPFDPLKNMSLSRSSCQPFGYAQIPYPVIVGTPAWGSTTPLSFTWTTPITGPWDNNIVNGSIVLTNTAVQPCAMSEIPSFVWDLTYWLSVIVLAVGWFIWLIGFVGRLSGEETING